MHSHNFPLPRIIFLCFILWEGLWASSSSHFEYLTISDGLSQSAVTSILQDKAGYLWFGTQDGLNKFDGYSFTIYKSQPFDTSKISDNWIQVLLNERNGGIWIGTHNGGLFLFDPQNETLINFDHHPANPGSLDHNRVWSLFQDTAGVLWVGTSAGLNRLPPDTKSFNHYLPAVGTSPIPVAVNAIAPCGPDSLWIGTWQHGLYLFDKRTGKFSPCSPLLQESEPLNVKALHRDHDGNLWIGTWNQGIIKFNPQSGETRNFRTLTGDKTSLSDNRILCIFEDDEKGLWFGTHSGGVNYFDRKTEKFTRYQHTQNNSYGLSNNWVPSILQDRSGNIWFGTGRGISKLRKNTRSFYHFYHDPNNTAGLSGNEINSIFQDSAGDIWVSTWGGGLNRFRISGKNFSGMDKVTFEKFRHIPGNPNSLSHNIVWVTFEDRNKNLWVGSYGGLDCFDPERKLSRHFYSVQEDTETLSHPNISALEEDSEGNLWVGTWGGGLNRFDPKTEKFRRFQFSPDNPTGISGNLITAVFEDREGNLWVGTAGEGLNLFQPQSGGFRRFTYSPSQPGSISSNSINTIFQDSKGILWIGTAGGGLNKADLSASSLPDLKFVHYSENNGFSNNMILGILEDENSRLWLSSNKGLIRFDPATEKSRVFLQEDGLQSNEFTKASFKTAEGAMIFGGINGLTLFYPQSIKTNNFLPPVYITRFEKMNRPGLIETINNIPTVKLSHDDQIFSFEFASLDFTAPERNEYSYKMEGFDEDWIHLGNSRRATFTNLNPGKYVFRARGSNSGGLWNTEDASVRVIITPPFWSTLWFRALMVLLILALIFIIFRLRIRGIEKQKINLEVQVADRTYELEQKNYELEEAISKIKTLRGLLPICSSCKKIRDDQGYWNQIEKYIREHSQAEFSHSICPDCARLLYPEIFKISK
ncbi:MAG: two-component regulator propeller domain-containing protein [Calditrichia bacterium]